MAPSSVRIAVAVPKDMHGKVIGRGAATLKDIESDYGVDLTVPQRDDPSDEVIIEGPPEMCEAAKSRVLDICGMAPDISGGAREEARRLYDKASDLFSQGRHDEAHEIRRQAEQANERAAQLIFKAKNKGYGNEQMDLHGLYVKEAMDFVRDRLVAVDSDLRSGALPSLTIITGFGHHSTNNEAKIKPQVEELLQERGYPFEADEAGGQFIVAFPDAAEQPQSTPVPTHTTPNLPQPPTQEPQNQHQQQPSGTGDNQEKSAFDILIALGTCLFTMCKKKYDQYQADASANTNANSRSAENVTDPAAQTETNTATPAQQEMARV